MAKRTKINAEAVAATNTPVVPTTTVVTPEVVDNNSNKVETVVTSEVPSKPSELEQFAVIKANIIKADDYIKFIELATKYNSFSKLDLNTLCKQDLICIIGAFIGDLYRTRDALGKMKQAEALRTQSSFDVHVGYGDLLDNVGLYKGWN